jgi:hypothetical protein
MADKDSSCMEDIKNVTMGCSSFDKDYSYPTEMLIHEMEPNTCKSVPFDTFEHFDSPVHWANRAPLWQDLEGVHYTFMILFPGL